MKTVMMILRIIFGLGLLFFGSNKLLHFMDPPPPPDDALIYWQALTVSKTMALVGLVEALAGISLLINKYSALMLVVLMSVSVNAVLYHVAYDPSSIVMAIVLLALNIVFMVQQKDKYAALLKS